MPTKELGLYTAPDYLANYIIKYKHPLENHVDFARLLIRVSLVDKIIFAFSEDLWPEMYECVRDILDVKRRFILSCQRQIAINPNGRPNNPNFRSAQQTINETVEILKEGYATMNGDNGPPPPYDSMAR